MEEMWNSFDFCGIFLEKVKKRKTKKEQSEFK
jgi:hypothetical protein